jgi:hypothetical protein|tara:strand:- start:110 stop:580 length:471 start_codon:yes stop_codon:yes gene_type:complete
MAKFYLDRYFAKAEQVRFETPVYDHYEDEYGDEQRECVREGTSKRSLCKRVQETNAPIYYFRRWNSRATDDKHYINHTYKDSCDVIAKTWGRRVLIMPRKMHRQLTDEAKKSFDKASKIKYNSPLDKMTKKKSDFEQLLSHYFDLNTAIIESNSSC